MFAEADVEFEDIRIRLEDWPKIKPQMPFGQLPVLYVDDVPIPQSGSIIRFLGRELGLSGQSSLETAKIDMVERRIVCSMSKMPMFEKDKAKKIKRAREVALTDVFPVYEKLEKMQSANGDGFLVGDNLTYADLIIYNTIHFITMILPVTAVKFPSLSALAGRVASRTRIMKYIEHRPKCPF